MDDDPPSSMLRDNSSLGDSSQDGSFQRITKLEDIGHKACGTVSVQDLDIDKYVLTDENSGISCVRFSAIADNYEKPVFYGKIFSDHYKIRWQTDCSLKELIDEIHVFFSSLEDTIAANDEILPFSYDTNGLKVVRDCCDEDVLIPLADLEPKGFWKDPIAFLHKIQIDSIIGLYFYTPFGELNFQVKDRQDTSQYELCLITHLEYPEALARLLSKTHRVHFSDDCEAQELLESTLTGYSSTFFAHFSQNQMEMRS